MVPVPYFRSPRWNTAASAADLAAPRTRLNAARHLALCRRTARANPRILHSNVLRTHVGLSVLKANAMINARASDPYTVPADRNARRRLVSFGRRIAYILSITNIK